MSNDKSGWMWEDIPGEPWSFEKPKITAQEKAEKKSYTPIRERESPYAGPALKPSTKTGGEFGARIGGHDFFNRTFYSKSGGTPENPWTNKAGLAIGAGVEGTLGQGKPGIEIGGKATAGLRVGAQIRQTDHLDMMINAQAGLLAEAGGKLKIQKTSADVGLEAFAGGKAGVDGTFSKFGIGVSAGAEGWAGAGAGLRGKFGWNSETRKFEVGGSAGVAWGLGGKLSGGIAIDPAAVMKSAKNLAVAKPVAAAKTVAALPGKALTTGVGKVTKAVGGALPVTKALTAGVGKATRLAPAAKMVAGGVGQAAKAVATGGLGAAAAKVSTAAVRKAAPVVSAVANSKVGKTLAPAASKVGQAKKWLASKFAAGGPVSGSGSSIGDMIPAVLSHGEFVVNAASAGRFKPLLEAINKTAPGFAQGLMSATAMPGWAGDQAKKALARLSGRAGAKGGNPALSAVLGKAAGGLGDAASAFVSGQTGDLLKNLGLPDQMPAAAKAGAQAVELLRSGLDPAAMRSSAQQAGSVAGLVAKQVIPAKALVRAGSAARKSIDQSMTINLQTPDVDTAFQKSKTWEAQRALTYAGRW
ncbi:hypothetical protein [Nocardia asteroides]